MPPWCLATEADSEIMRPLGREVRWRYYFSMRTLGIWSLSARSLAIAESTAGWLSSILPSCRGVNRRDFLEAVLMQCVHGSAKIEQFGKMRVGLLLS